MKPNRNGTDDFEPGETIVLDEDSTMNTSEFKKLLVRLDRELFDEDDPDD